MNKKEINELQEVLSKYLNEIGKLEGTRDINTVNKQINSIINSIAKYTNELVKSNVKYNLIGNSTIENLFKRHIIDSLQLISYIVNCIQCGNNNIDEDAKSATDNQEYSKPTNSRTCSNLNIADIGTGGGMPGIIIAIVIKQANVMLIEKSPVKREFLNNVIQKLELKNAQVVGNIYDYPKGFFQNINIIVSRAFKPLKNILQISSELFNQPSLILLKGKKYKDEILDAETEFNMSVSIGKSVTHEDGVVLSLNEYVKKNKG